MNVTLQWQQTEDFSRKKEIRAHMYRLREERLRNLYSPEPHARDAKGNTHTQYRYIFTYLIIMITFIYNYALNIAAPFVRVKGAMEVRSRFKNIPVSSMGGNRAMGEMTISVQNHNATLATEN